MAESEEKLKGLLMKVKEDSEKVSLKLTIQKTKIMSSGPITSWKIDGETVETVADFILLGSKSLEGRGWGLKWAGQRRPGSSPRPHAQRGVVGVVCLMWPRVWTDR